MVALGLQLGDHDDRQHDLVLGEAQQRERVGEQDGGVEDERARRPAQRLRLGEAGLASPIRAEKWCTVGRRYPATWRRRRTRHADCASA